VIMMAEIKFLCVGWGKKSCGFESKEFDTLKEAWKYKRNLKEWIIDIEIYDDSFKMKKYRIILLNGQGQGKLVWDTSDIYWNLPSFRIRNMVKKITFRDLDKLIKEKDIKTTEEFKELIAPKIKKGISSYQNILKIAKLPNKEFLREYLMKIYPKYTSKTKDVIKTLNTEEKIAYFMGFEDGLFNAVSLLILKNDD